MRTLLAACGLALSLLGAPLPAAAQDSRVGLAWYLPSWDQLPFTSIQHGEVEYLGARSQSQTSYLSDPEARLKATILLKLLEAARSDRSPAGNDPDRARR